MFLIRRPFIALTLAYIAALLAADHCGFFSPPTASLKAPGALQGEVIRPPEEKNGRFSFILKPVQPGAGNVLVITRSPDEKIDAGDRLELTGTFRRPHRASNDGGFDYAAYLARSNIFALFYPDTIARTAHRNVPWYWQLARAVRADIIRTIEAHVPAENARVLIPMIVGGTEGVPREITNEFNSSGVMHILVVSGLNVAYCSFIFLCVFRLFGLRRRYAALCTIPFILLYVFVTGANPPVVRAGVMALFVIISLGLAREPNIYQSLSLAAAAILIGDPQALFTASFQLSFAATFGIVYAYPYFMKPFERLPFAVRHSVGSVFCVSLAAQLAVLPILAWYFNKVSLIGLVSNIVIVPLVGFISAAGLILYFVHGISPLLTTVAATGASYLVSLLLFLVHFFASVPHAVAHVATPSLLFIAAYYLFFIGIFQIKKHTAWYAAFIPLLLWGAVAVHAHGKASRHLKVTFLDVANGDAIHVRFPSGTNWLIDAGGTYPYGSDAGERVVCPYLWSNGITSLDTLVITHPHLQHYGGAETVMNNIPVRRILYNPDVSQEQEFLSLMECVQEKKIPGKEIWAGDRFTVDGCTVSVLSPGVLGPAPDDNCLVLALDYEGKRMILTSDMSEHTEQQLLSANAVFANVLQSPNHGHRKLTDSFLAKSAADRIILSQGKTHDERILYRRKKTYSTEQHGQVTVSMARQGISVKTFR